MVKFAKGNHVFDSHGVTLLADRSRLFGCNFNILIDNSVAGYQDKEMMLGIGTRILGIGRVVADDGRMRIEPPDNGRTYYLTTQTKSEVLKSIRSR